jgi:hypothetical protein
MNFAKWTPPIWRLPWEITIGHNGTMPTESFTQSPANKKEYSALMKDPRLQPLCTQGFGNECGRLFQGNRDVPETDTCLFTTLKNIPKDRNITYSKIVCDYKPHKQEK